MPTPLPEGGVGRAGAGAYATGRSSEWQDPSASAEAVLDEIRSLIEQSPTGALQALSEYPVETLHIAPTAVLQRTFAALATALPSARLGTLAAQTERIARQYSVDAFLCLDEVARASRTPSVAQQITASYRRLLTPEALRLLALGYFPKATNAALRFPILDDRARLRMIVVAIGERLAEFDAGTLYRLAGWLSTLLSLTEAASMLDKLVARAWSRLPSDVRAAADAQLAGDNRAVAQSASDPSSSVQAMVRLLTDLHGHPAQRVRWGAVHATVDLALTLPEPTLEFCVAETFDEAHARWLTKREWLLFTLECLARRRPEALVPLATRIAEHALTTELPHAKIRHHARQVVLAIDRAVPGALNASLVERVRAVNQPIALCTPRREKWSPVKAERDYRDKRRAWPEYHFDAMDTLPYWYQPLARVFDVTQDDIGDIAYEWIVGRWGITRSMVEAAWTEERNRLKYEEYGHRHGSEPSVEILERYADRHGLYVAAGTLVDTRAAVNDGPREGDRWSEWSRRYLREADPALTARLLSPAPPEMPDQYGRFLEPFDTWQKSDRLDEFLAEFRGAPLPLPPLPAPGAAEPVTTITDAEWIVIAAQRSGSFSDRDFSARVEAVLVSPRTAEALQRLIHDAPREIPLPEFNLGYDTILAELEHDMRARSDYYVFEQNVIRTRGGLFRIEPLFAACQSSLAFECKDPRWSGTLRPFLIPILDFVERLRLTRREHELLWREPNGTPGARCEVWFERDGDADYSDQSDGARLLVRRDLLLKYAQQRGSDVLFVVTLRRSRSYRYRRYGAREEDEQNETTSWVAFRLQRDGVILVTPRGTRAPDERERRDQGNDDAKMATSATDPGHDTRGDRDTTTPEGGRG